MDRITREYAVEAYVKEVYFGDFCHIVLILKDTGRELDCLAPGVIANNAIIKLFELNPGLDKKQYFSERPTLGLVNFPEGRAFIQEVEKSIDESETNELWPQEGIFNYSRIAELTYSIGSYGEKG